MNKCKMTFIAIDQSRFFFFKCHFVYIGSFRGGNKSRPFDQTAPTTLGHETQGRPKVNFWELTTEDFLGIA